MKKMISRILMAALAAIFICGGTAARATTLTGTVNNPDGSSFNGTIFLTLSQAATVSTAGSCGGPIYVSNSFQVAIQVVAGAIVSSPNIYDSNCFNVSGAIPYSVQLASATGQVVQQTWVVTSTPLQTGSENVGTIIPLTYAGGLFQLPIAFNVNSLLFGTTTVPMSATAPAGSTNYLCVISSQIAGCAGGGSGSMTWPGAAGVPNYNGSSAYGTSYGASNPFPANFLPSALQNGTTGTTQSPGDNTAKLATDAFVMANGSSGGASTPATPLVLKGNGSANGVVAASPITDFQVPLGVSLANYGASNLPVTYGNPVSGSNVVAVQNAAAAGWVTGEGIYIPSVTSVGAQPGSGVTCDNVTISGNNITMLNVGGSACNAPASWNPANFSVPVLHFNMGHGAITSGSNTLTTTAPTFVSGQGIMVKGAGASGADLICPVISVSGSTFTLFQANGSTACNAGTTVTVAQVFHDDTHALQNALAASAAWPGAQVHIPTGTYFLSSESDIVNPVTIYGDGPYQSYFVSDEDAINTIVTKTSGVNVRRLAIIGAENFTPTSGNLLQQCDATDNCWNDYYEDLYLYGGWTMFAQLGDTLQGSLSHSTLHKPQHAAIYVDSPQGPGDFNYDSVIGVNCSSCGNGAEGIIIDAGDTNAWNNVKMNSFVKNLDITGNIGIVDHQRFNNVSFEGGAVSIQKLSTFGVFANQINGGEFEFATSNLTVGNGVVQTQLNNMLVDGGTNCFDIAGQGTVVSSNTFQGCTGDGISLEATATGTISANTMQTIGAWGIHDLGVAAGAIQITANLFTGTTSGDYTPTDAANYFSANEPATAIAKYINNATGVGGYAGFFANSGTGSNVYSTVASQGLEPFQGNKDATPTEAFAFAYGVPTALTGNNPTFSYYAGSGWLGAWFVNAANGQVNFYQHIVAPGTTFSSSAAGASVETVSNTATGAGGYAATFSNAATGSNVYAVLVGQGLCPVQGNKDATPSEAFGFCYGVNGALTGNNPYFNFYNGTAWAGAWFIDSTTGNTNFLQKVITPSLLAAGIVDGTTPIATTTTTPVTLGGTYHSGYTFNNDGATAVTYTLPTAAAGLQYCVANYTGATGTLKVATSATGQFIDNAGANTATGGYVISGGALGDAGCFVGMSATNWKLYIQAGTWATH